MPWTKQQQKVIDQRDADILVSAAAGSGTGNRSGNGLITKRELDFPALALFMSATDWSFHSPAAAAPAPSWRRSAAWTGNPDGRRCWPW